MPERRSPPRRVRLVSGRVKSDYRYSSKAVYNICSWPDASAKQREQVEAQARIVLAARARFMECGDSSPLSAGDLSPSNPPSATAASRAAGRGSALPASRQSGNSGDKSPHSKSATLADLYDPLAMPPELLKAHTELDRAVEKCYRPEPFHSDRERVEFLLSLYEKRTAPLVPVASKTKGRRSQTTITAPTPRKQRAPGLPGQT